MNRYLDGNPRFYYSLMLVTMMGISLVSAEAVSAETCNRALLYNNFPRAQADQMCDEINAAGSRRRSLYDNCQNGNTVACDQYNIEADQLMKRREFNNRRNQQWQNSRDTSWW